MVETIQWTPDGVVMIDQTKLPREETYVTCRTYEEVAEAIRRNDQARVDFLLESARFVIGEEVKAALATSSIPDPGLIGANVELK